ncbi:Uncharacterised protein [Mycobacteroides abscessus subsp. abscessus]|nr:Uncharacterised protein [Mycobacteroides abscessus subsp. abscessus]
MHDDIHTGRVRQLSKFHGAELDLGRATSREDMDVGGPVERQTLVYVGGNLGAELFIGGLGQHSGDIERDISGAEDRNTRGRQRPVPGDVGVAVIPGHEVGGTIAFREVDAGDIEPPIGAGSGREDHRVVEPAQLRKLDIGAVMNVSDEADLIAGEHPAQCLDDLLDTWMVRGHSVTHQSVRRR